MTLSGAAGKVPVGPLRREGLGCGCQPKSLCHLPGWAAVVTVAKSVVASGSQTPQSLSTFCKTWGVEFFLYFSFSYIYHSIFIVSVFPTGRYRQIRQLPVRFSYRSCRIFRRVVTAHSAPLGAANSCNTAVPFRLTVPARAPANHSVPERRTIRRLFPAGSAAVSRHWPVKGSHRACRRLSSARWYPGPTTVTAPTNGRTAACFRREVPGKVLPTEGWTGSSGTHRYGSGFPLRERVHGSDGTSLGYGLVMDFGFWHPSFPVGFVLERCSMISS